MLTDEQRAQMTGTLTKEEALSIYETSWWKDMPDLEVARIQLGQRRLCMEFVDFHDAVERALNRGVFTHEFVDTASLLEELNGARNPPTMDQIMGKLP